MRARFLIQQFETGAAGFAQLPRDIEPQSRSGAVRRKKRFEHLITLRRIDTRAIVNDMQFNAVCGGGGPGFQSHRAVRCAGMAESVPEQVPQHTIKVAPIKTQLDITFAHLYALGGRRVVQGQLLQKSRKENPPAQGFGLRAITATKFKHLGHEPIETTGIVMNDAGQTLTQGIGVFLGEQLRRVADRRQRIANLMRHIGREPAKGRQL